MKKHQSLKKWKFRVTLVQDLGNLKNRCFSKRKKVEIRAKNRFTMVPVVKTSSEVYKNEKIIVFVRKRTVQK